MQREPGDAWSYLVQLPAFRAEGESSEKIHRPGRGWKKRKSFVSILLLWIFLD